MLGLSRGLVGTRQVTSHGETLHARCNCWLGHESRRSAL